MKQLTNLAVTSVMDLLIHTNGQTTTLEIKTQLRDLGYMANQLDVHNFVEDIYIVDLEGKYTRTPVNTTYNVYKFTQDFIDTNNSVTQANNDLQNLILGSSSTSLPSGVNTSGLQNTPIQIDPVSRDPLFIFYTENHARKSGVNPKVWVVYHKDGDSEIHIFDSRLTRDQVRSRYTSIMKTKIQDVRSCRFENY